MTDRVADNTESPPRASLSTVIRRVEAPLREVLTSFRLPVRFAWSQPGPEEDIVVGFGTETRMSADSISELQQRGTDLLKKLRISCTGGEEAPDRSYPRWFGGVCFPLHSKKSDLWAPFGSVSFLLPSVQVTQDEEGTWITVTGSEVTGPDPSTRMDTIYERIRAQHGRDRKVARTPQLEYVSQQPADINQWSGMVQHVLESVENGELQKAVLAQRRTLSMRDRPDEEELLLCLLDDPSDSYRFLLRRDNRMFIGRSPECLVRKDGRNVRSESIGGTVEAGSSARQTKAFAEKLRGNRKDQREHSLVVRSIRDRLAPFTESVEEGDQTVRLQSNVQHLCTPIDATLSGDQHVLDLVEALHPTAAVGGLPRDRALEIIQRLEPFERGLYGGPVGWFDKNGDGCFAVGIRSGLLEEERVHLYAGAGIVEGSEPEAEWEEVQWKFETMTDLLDDPSESDDPSRC